MMYTMFFSGTDSTKSVDEKFSVDVDQISKFRQRRVFGEWILFRKTDAGAERITKTYPVRGKSPSSDYFADRTSAFRDPAKRSPFQFAKKELVFIFQTWWTMSCCCAAVAMILSIFRLRHSSPRTRSDPYFPRIILSRTKRIVLYFATYTTYAQKGICQTVRNPGKTSLFCNEISPRANFFRAPDISFRYYYYCYYFCIPKRSVLFND